MRKLINLVGQQFERLSVEKYAGRNKRGKATWRVLCACGNRLIVLGESLNSGNTKSCGCLKRQQQTRAKVHGQARRGRLTPEYRAYLNAKQRCTNPDRPDYKYYGERGIKFLFSSFEEFFASVGQKPSPRHELDRTDVNGNYQKGNVGWVTKEQTRRNTRRTTLNEAKVREMRERYATGEVARAQLAMEYGVTLGNLKSILYLKSWNLSLPKKPSRSVKELAKKETAIG